MRQNLTGYPTHETGEATLEAEAEQRRAVRGTQIRRPRERRGRKMTNRDRPAGFLHPILQPRLPIRVWPGKMHACWILTSCLIDANTYAKKNPTPFRKVGEFLRRKWPPETEFRQQEGSNL